VPKTVLPSATKPILTNPQYDESASWSNLKF